MTASASRTPPQGALAELRELAARVPSVQARVVREVAQKECEADQKAHDALLTRGNTLLAASGVAVSLLIGFSKESVVDTDVEKSLLVVALVAAVAAAILVILSIKPFAAASSLNNRTIVGNKVLEVASETNWQRDHELCMALSYLDVRITLAERHQKRSSCLRAAQWAYLVFLGLVTALGIAIPF